MNRASLIMALSAAFLPLSVPGQAASQSERTFQTTVRREITLRYLLSLPDGYETDPAREWPLLLFLHGAGERGDDLERVKVHGPPKLVAQGQKLPFIVVSPQCAPDTHWDDESLILLLDDVTASLRVDRHRTYVTGLSMGGFGTWSLVTTHPERFAAAAPICGGGEPVDILLTSPAKKEAIAHVPIWCFHGAKDSVVPLLRSEMMVDAVNAIGGNAKLTVYPDANHDSWTRTYEMDELFDWFLAHSR